LRRGTCTEERRRITAEQVVCTCNTILTVHENWCTNPATNDNIDVGYLLQDAATVTGFGLINKRVQDYTSSRALRIGDCPPGCYAQFDILDGASLETVDRSCTCCADIYVRNNSAFGNGYRANCVGVNGGYLIGTPALANELVFEAQNGSHLRICDKLFFTMVNNPEVRILGACSDGTVRMKNVFGTNQMEVTASAVTYECMDVVGKDGTCDVLDVGGNVTMSCITLVDMGPIRNENANCTQECFTFRNVIFVGNAGNIITEQASSNNKDWTLINPKYTCDPPTTCIGLVGANSSVTEQFRVTAVSQQTDGTKIQNTRFKISEVTPCDALVNEVNSDACGLAVMDITKRVWAGACETLTTHACFALKTYDYGFTPFVTSQTVANKTGGFGQCTTITQLTDSFVCASEACAVACDTVAVTIIESTACNNHSLVKWTAGTGCLASGDTIRQCATNLGTVHILEGNSTAGTGFIVARTATNVANCSTLCEVGGWSATYTNCTEQRFYWAYDAGQKTGADRNAQQVYDYQIANLGAATLCPAATWEIPIEWGRAEHAIPLQGCGTKFKTVRNVAQTRGWGVVGLTSLGGISLFTDDSGGTFSPAATVCVDVTVTDSGGTAVSGARVGIFTDPVCSGDTALLCGSTNACGVYSCSITVAGDTNVIVRVRLKGFIPFQTSGVISASTGLSVGVTFITDASVDLP
jgi:hypothetical protein